MNYTAIILEDEQLAARRLKRLVDEVAPEIEVLEVFESVKAIENFLSSMDTHPDILFIDINVSDGNSFELFNKVKVNCKIIFTTAFDEYAVLAFRKNAIDYLLKPIKREQLQEAIDKAKSAIKKSDDNAPQYKERFLIRFGTRLHTIKANDIAYIYSKDKISYFYSKDVTRVPSDFKLQDLESQLSPHLFFRANRQFIIHIDSIVDIIKHDSARVRLVLEPKLESDLVISTEKTRAFKKWLQR